jgi:CelD/BcsL family acetyltransferase involved in cellulose biosynthesis
LDQLTGLHRKRAEMRGKVGHDDVLRGTREQEFLTLAVRDLARDGLARVHLATNAGTAVAGMLVLSDGDTDYISVTGLDPRVWSLSLNTLLTFEALSYACRAGRTAVNLSTGPDVAKLRWSPEIRSWNDFVVVRADPVSRWAYGAYSHVSFALQRRQERTRHAVRE